jgi:predicted enzyme related to lactoylglutathione lyase
MVTVRRRTPPARRPKVALRSLALRVHNMDAMVAFYGEAFGVRFEPVATGGLTSWFGTLGSLALKFVPIRDAADFDGYPIHQPGFEVGDVRRVVRLAERHGGAVHDAPIRRGGRLLASVRDPDGNTIELYGPPGRGRGVRAYGIMAGVGA